MEDEETLTLTEEQKNPMQEKERNAREESDGKIRDSSLSSEILKKPSSGRDIFDGMEYGTKNNYERPSNKPLDQRYF